uniref:Uncharacterized protein n=1 Tax=Helianthus annuus TaxID=4232 RepID=A0A251SA04_HELAN
MDRHFGSVVSLTTCQIKKSTKRKNRSNGLTCNILAEPPLFFSFYWMFCLRPAEVERPKVVLDIFMGPSKTNVLWWRNRSRQA